MHYMINVCIASFGVLNSCAKVCLDVGVELRLNEFARCIMLQHRSVVYRMTATVANHGNDLVMK